MTDPQEQGSYSIDIQMRFTDIDMFGHVNNTAYMQYLDIAKVRFFEQTLGEHFDPDATPIVIVNVNCDYMAQTRSDEEVRVTTRCTAVGRSSLRLEQRVTNRLTGELKCLGRTVLVLIDRATGHSVEIPDNWKALLLGGAGQ